MPKPVLAALQLRTYEKVEAMATMPGFLHSIKLKNGYYIFIIFKRSKMRRFFSGLVVIGFLVVWFFSCKKEIRSTTEDSIFSNTDENVSNTVCSNFTYPDSIIYLKEQTGDYIVKPLKSQLGRYGAFPSGIIIDSLTGAINVTRSETGLKYMVWFLPANKTDTCRKYVTISGINYLDSIYVLKSGTTTSAIPVFNANITNTKAGVTARRGEPEAEYDDGHDDDDKDGFADEPPAGERVIPKGVALNKSTGAINLNQTVVNGVFGASPGSGSFKDFILNYRVYKDSSKGTLNHLTFRMYYFKNKASIPFSLKQTIAAKRNLLLLGNSQPSTLRTASLTAREKEVKCRPAYIIVVGQ